MEGVRTRPAGRLSGADRREQLLDVAKGLALDHGFHALSIEGIARAAGITRPVVYSHFGDLDGLLEALVQRERIRALTQLAEILPSAAPAENPREAWLDAMSAYARAAERDPQTWRLVLMPPEGAPEALRQAVADGRDAVIAQLTEIVAAGFGAGGTPPDPELAARMISAFADEAIRLLLTDPARYPADRILATARWMLDESGPFA